jgi:hypothetical protein
MKPIKAKINILLAIFLFIAQFMINKNLLYQMKQQK